MPLHLKHLERQVHKDRKQNRHFQELEAGGNAELLFSFLLQTFVKDGGEVLEIAVMLVPQHCE